MKIGNVTPEHKEMFRVLTKQYWENLSQYEQEFIRGNELSIIMTDKQIAFLESLFEKMMNQDDEQDAVLGWEDY